MALLVGCSIPQSSVSVPANLTASAGNGTVTLVWTASSGATRYNVKRGAISGGPYIQLSTSATAGYTDTSVINGSTYYYVVSALDSAGESENSTQVSATPTAPTTPPPAPTNLTATAGNAQASLTWSASSGGATYRLKRSTTNGGPYTQIAAPTGTSYTDTPLTNGTIYYYVVSAVNLAGESANSAQVSAFPVVLNPPPTTFGTWTNVTPQGVDLQNTLCSNYGARTVQVDPAHPSNLYTAFDCQGIWKSTDFGATWTGPINTGTNAALVSDCSGGLSIAPGSTASVPTIYLSCIRGSALGFWKSADGGVNWTRIVIAASSRQDYSPPVVDPYDDKHLLMSGHEFDSVVESVDGGLNWTSVSLASGMLQTSLSSAIFFLNTGNPATTRRTWLWIGDQSSGATGTWRTVNGGAGWVQVDKNEHVGNTQIYQPDTSGVVYMTGNGSALGAGVLRSSDFGQTWRHVGPNNTQSVVVGTSKNVYAMFGYPVGLTGSVNPNFQVAAQPGTGTWVLPGTPASLNLEGTAQIIVVNDGTHNILIGAMWNRGVWRYVEP
ncbi:MAG: fibronectin type III domain-containing protein [Gemmatimonadaceae bacterium]